MTVGTDEIGVVSGHGLLREEAKSLPLGYERQAVLSRAEQAKTFTNNDGLLRRHPTTGT
jgi:hypothetical protein